MVRIASRLPVRDILNFCVTTSYVTHVLLNSRNLWNFLLQRDFTQQMQLDENVLTMENNYDGTGFLSSFISLILLTSPHFLTCSLHGVPRDVCAARVYGDAAIRNSMAGRSARQRCQR